MPIFLAIDAGGTKTDYVLADESRELARVRTGTIKRMRTDEVTAAANLDFALRQLSAQASVSMQHVTRTCIGAAGETVPLVADWLRSSLASSVSGELILLGDVEIALDAAFEGNPGVLVLAGTGSNVAGRGEDGLITTAGGWGPAIADQGSGHRIGHEALRAAFLAIDEGRSTTLIAAILAFWNLNSLDQLIEFGNSIPAPDFSRMTELIVHLANDGDEVAADVLRSEGVSLGYLVRLVLRRLIAQNQDVEDVPPVAFAGSIMENVAPVREALLVSVRREFPAVHVRTAMVEPVAGALWRARNSSIEQSFSAKRRT